MPSRGLGEGGRGGACVGSEREAHTGETDSGRGSEKVGEERGVKNGLPKETSKTKGLDTH